MFIEVVLLWFALCTEWMQLCSLFIHKKLCWVALCRSSPCLEWHKPLACCCLATWTIAASVTRPQVASFLHRCLISISVTLWVFAPLCYCTASLMHLRLLCTVKHATCSYMCITKLRWLGLVCSNRASARVTKMQCIYLRIWPQRGCLAEDRPRFNIP